MSLIEETRVLVALTRALGEAVARDDLEAAASLLAEREARLRRIAGSPPSAVRDEACAAALAELAAAEQRVQAQLGLAMAETGAALGRLANAKAPATPTPSPRNFDRKV